MGKLKTRTWILLIAALAAVFALLTRYTLARQAPGRKAEVVQDGKVLYTIDLNGSRSRTPLPWKIRRADATSCQSNPAVSAWRRRTVRIKSVWNRAG